MLGVLVDDGEFSARAKDAAHFGYGPFDIDSVFERFGGVDAVKGGIGERELGQDAGNLADSRGNGLKHSFGDIEAGNPRVRILFEQHARISAFATPGIEQTFARDGREEAQQNLHVQNARIDRGREVLFVARCLVEALTDLAAKIVS